MAALFLPYETETALSPEFYYNNLLDLPELGVPFKFEEPCLFNLSLLPSLLFRALAKELTDLTDLPPELKAEGLLDPGDTTLAFGVLGDEARCYLLDFIKF